VDDKNSLEQFAEKLSEKDFKRMILTRVPIVLGAGVLAATLFFRYCTPKTTQPTVLALKEFCGESFRSTIERLPLEDAAEKAFAYVPSTDSVYNLAKTARQNEVILDINKYITLLEQNPDIYGVHTHTISTRKTIEQQYFGWHSRFYNKEEFWKKYGWKLEREEFFHSQLPSTTDVQSMTGLMTICFRQHDMKCAQRFFIITKNETPILVEYELNDETKHLARAYTTPEERIRFMKETTTAYYITILNYLKSTDCPDAQNAIKKINAESPVQVTVHTLP